MIALYAALGVFGYLLDFPRLLATSHQPPATSQQSAVRSQQPSVSSQQSGVSSRQSAVSSQQSANGKPGSPLRWRIGQGREPGFQSVKLWGEVDFRE